MLGKIDGKQPLRTVGELREFIAELDDGVPGSPNWIWGRASCGEGDAPICSKCTHAVAPSAMADHEKTCWEAASPVAA